jgi:hypothetical protein
MSLFLYLYCVVDGGTVTASGNSFLVKGANSIFIICIATTNYIQSRNDSFIFFNNSFNPRMAV